MGIKSVRAVSAPLAATDQPRIGMRPPMAYRLQGDFRKPVLPGHQLQRSGRKNVQVDGERQVIIVFAIDVQRGSVAFGISTTSLPLRFRAVKNARKSLAGSGTCSTLCEAIMTSGFDQIIPRLTLIFRPARRPATTAHSEMSIPEAFQRRYCITATRLPEPQPKSHRLPWATYMGTEKSRPFRTRSRPNQANSGFGTIASGDNLATREHSASPAIVRDVASRLGRVRSPASERSNNPRDNSLPVVHRGHRRLKHVTTIKTAVDAERTPVAVVKVFGRHGDVGTTAADSALRRSGEFLFVLLNRQLESSIAICCLIQSAIRVAESRPKYSQCPRTKRSAAANNPWRYCSSARIRWTIAASSPALPHWASCVID